MIQGEGVMLRIYICDDEKEMTDLVSSQVRSYFKTYPSEYEIETFNSGSSLIEQVNKQRADIIFLDIDLLDSNGIQIAKLIRRVDKLVKIVFITNYKNYKGAAFTVRAFGYVEKPSTEKQIFKQLSDIQTYMEEEQNDVSIKFETVDGLINLKIKDILYFESNNRKISIITFTNEYRMVQKISSLAKLFENYDFKSPHSSFLVNLDYVVGIKNYTVYMVNDIKIPLSQRKVLEFKKAMNHYFMKTIDLCKGVPHE